MSGQLLREAKHHCAPPYDDLGAVWRCECGRRWVCVLDYTASPNGRVWKRRLLPWPRGPAAEKRRRGYPSTTGGSHPVGTQDPTPRGRPRRQVIDHPQGYGIAGEDFHTTDRTLAEQVAAELDRANPLPCTGHEWIEITQFGDPEPRMICKWCSLTGLESEVAQ